jgi:hypothetical protein
MAKTLPLGFGHLRAKPLDANLYPLRAPVALFAMLTTSKRSDRCGERPSVRQAHRRRLDTFDKLRAGKPTTGVFLIEFSKNNRYGITRLSFITDKCMFVQMSNWTRGKKLGQENECSMRPARTRCLRKFK